MDKKFDALRADIPRIPDSLSVNGLWDGIDEWVDKLFDKSEQVLLDDSEREAHKKKSAILKTFALGILVENPQGLDITELSQSPAESD